MTTTTNFENGGSHSRIGFYGSNESYACMSPFIRGMVPRFAPWGYREADQAGTQVAREKLITLNNRGTTTSANFRTS